MHFAQKFTQLQKVFLDKCIYVIYNLCEKDGERK